MKINDSTKCWCQSQTSHEQFHGNRFQPFLYRVLTILKFLKKKVLRMIFHISISISFSEVAAKLIKIFFSPKTEARPGYQKRLVTLPLLFSSVSSKSCFWSDATSISDAINNMIIRNSKESILIESQDAKRRAMVAEAWTAGSACQALAPQFWRQLTQRSPFASRLASKFWSKLSRIQISFCIKSVPHWLVLFKIMGNYKSRPQGSCAEEFRKKVRLINVCGVGAMYALKS